MFPFGWNVSDLSLFLALDDTPKFRWQTHAHFTFTVVNQKKEKNMSSSSQHVFSNHSLDQGFQRIAAERNAELRDPKKGFLTNGKDLTIRLEVEVSRCFPHQVVTDISRSLNHHYSLKRIAKQFPIIMTPN